MAENKIPVGVWVFWSIIGLLLIGLIGSLYPTFGGALAFFLSVLGALGGAVAGIAAYLAVKEIGKDRQEERLNRRPYFSFIDGEIGIALDDEAQYGESEYLHIKCRQIGTNPATLVTMTVNLVRQVDNGFIEPEVVISRPVNDTPTGFEEEINRGGLHLDNSQHHYVILNIEYSDAIYRFPFTQTFYLQWNGLDSRWDPEDRKSPLYPITREALPGVLSLLRLDE